MKVFIPLIAYNIYIILEAYQDSVDGKKTHWVDWVLRVMWGGLVSYQMFAISWPFIAFGWGLMAWTWFLFNTSYNLFSHRDSPIYVGQTASSDVFFRKHFPKAPGLAMLIIQITTLVGALAFLILSLPNK